MEILNQETLNLVEATLAVVSSFLPKRVDVIFLHSRSFGDYDEVLELTAKCYAESRALNIALSNNEGERYGSDVPYEANPGKTFFRSRLLSYGVPDRDIVDSVLKSRHTGEETEGFIDLSQREGWVSAAVVSQPHQSLRTMLHTLKVMEKRGYGMEIFTMSPPFVSWFQEVFGSQGAEKKLRLAHVEDEYRKIVDYTNQNQLASFEELFTYLETREQGKLVTGKLDKGSSLFYRRIL